MIFYHPSSFTKAMISQITQPKDLNQGSQYLLGQQSRYPSSLLGENLIKIQCKEEEEQRQGPCMHNSKMIKLKCQINAQKIRLIDQTEGKYKRATNNSHKKFINVAKKLFLSYLLRQDKDIFRKTYHQYDNTRTFFFIILINACFRLKAEQLTEFKANFMRVMKNRMDFFRKEADSTSNNNFINFRCEQILDMQFALKAFDLFFKGQIQEAATVLYRKQKVKIRRKNEYLQCLNIINNIINQFKVNNQMPGGQFVKKQQMISDQEGKGYILYDNPERNNNFPLLFLQNMDLNEEFIQRDIFDDTSQH